MFGSRARFEIWLLTLRQSSQAASRASRTLMSDHGRYAGSFGVESAHFGNDRRA
jgi:hypothetical protein